MTNVSTKLLTVAQFAEGLGVTPACIRRWLLERKVASVRVGRLVRLPETELQRIVQEGFIPARPKPGTR
jgi:excisionase family DNA binding protein